MTRSLILLGLVLLAACRQEPDFDERYKAAQQRLDAKAAAIDKELEATQAENLPANSNQAGDARVKIGESGSTS